MPFKKFIHNFLNLFYPPLCLHCQNSLEPKNLLLCHVCQELMLPLHPSERCPGCFSDQFDPDNEKYCSRCKKAPLDLEGAASVFDHAGPAATLVKQLKYSNKPWLAKGLAAYLAFQLLQLDWPQPDLIIPMPISWLRKLDRGYNQTLLLAQELSKLISIPTNDLLQRRCGDFSQAGLNQAQRLQLPSNSITLKKNIKLYDKTILLIDDVMTSGRSLTCCAQALLPAFPAHIYSLTICRAIE